MKNEQRIRALREGYSATYDEEVREIAMSWGSVMHPENKCMVLSVEGGLGDYFAWTSYTSLRAHIEIALDDDDCDKIAILINSPGGDVAGLFEVADYIREAKQKKPIYAHVTGMACSAAYAIASACTKVYATQTSEIGSIGVYAEAVDYSEMQKKQGILSRIFRSKNAEKKNLSAFTEEGAEDLQSKVDYYEDRFYDLLSAERGIDREKCIDDFGHGAVFLAGDALEKGMIDGVMSYSEFAENVLTTNSSFEDEGEEGEDMDIEKMSAEEKKSVFNALIADNPSLLAEARDEAAENERVRIEALNAERNEHNGEIIDAAVADGRTVAEIALELFRAERDYSARLAADPMALIAKQAEGQQDLEVSAPMPNDTRAKADKVAETVTAARKNKELQ